MEKTTINGKKGVFFEDAEFEKLQSKILSQRKLIDELQEELAV